MSKARNFQHLILSLRQRGMQAMTQGVRDDGTHYVDMTYLSPGMPLQYVTIVGRSDIDVLENCREHLVEHGLPV